ncbi:hypothetical protein DVA67_015395 [Solirubrobacter sp. CPCC 204708]|uniref:Lipoprotein n=1 Tax=Solirubrobacter deserti TaxID=2282478 RepID=A0ABT4RKL4_9ACTN|nr:hypothetical protein [Solirubrobacter deserti]MBE2317366.1 hypothetical protein [Solirubrobacter deserti]MDA0139095.1 hypothetical protein [Solirubrobacter deserti]
MTRHFVVLALAVLFAACGGETPSAKAPSAAAGAPDRRAADGEGLARFIVDGFNDRLLGCDYGRVVEGLQQQIRLFVPEAQSSLFGFYSIEDYTGEPDPYDPTVHSAENPPPTREAELANLLALFPEGRLAQGLASPDGGEGAPYWPFNGDNDLDLQALAGISFAEICRTAVRTLSGGDPGRLRAQYRRDGSDVDGHPTWILSFPRGSAEDRTLRVEENRRLVVKETADGWSILRFTPKT